MRKLIATLFMLFMSTFAQASDAYDFASRSITVFDVVRAGTSPKQTVKKSSDPIAGIQGLMRQSLTQNAAFREAQSGIATFLKSPNQEIRGSASMISESLKVLEILGNQTTAICEKFLNNPAESAQAPGTAMRQLFETEERSKAAWRAYIAASTTVAIALTASDRQVDGKLHYLNITRKEREKLKGQLIYSFGSSIRQGSRASDQNNILPAALFWEFLNDKWKSSDE